jgi:hypothetical protein
MDSTIASPAATIGVVAGVFLIGIILYYLIVLFFFKDHRMGMIIKGVLNGNEDGRKYDQPASEMNKIAGASEYSFSFWAYIDTFDGKRHVILKRAEGGLVNPEVILSEDSNTMVVRMSNVAGDVLSCDIKMVPLQRWNCFSINVLSNSINVYMNGRLYRSCTFFNPNGGASSGLPFPNVNAPLEVKHGVNFPGKIASMFFRNSLMSAEEVMGVYRAGPNAGATGLLYRLFGIKEIRVVFDDVQ